MGIYSPKQWPPDGSPEYIFIRDLLILLKDQLPGFKSKDAVSIFEERVKEGNNGIIEWRGISPVLDACFAPKDPQGTLRLL